MNEKDQILKEILLAADKHPNSRVSKLIRLIESDRSQKNIVLLLIELAEHSEYATDFGISLKYYLDLFERLGVGRDIMLNETGLLLLNSSKIYSRRVDYVHELIEHQILTLSNADQEISNAKNNQKPNLVEKPKRGRKRLLETPKDPYEIELVPKKFKKLSHEKRFATNSATTGQQTNNAKLKAQIRPSESEQYIHPTGWTYSTIVDLENEEEIDSKRNYKLFTYHVEHRYNTLVPDINFRLHFMVKDYIDEEEEQMEEEYRESGQYPSERVTTWPPLSEAYVEQYLNLEDRILKCGHTTTKRITSQNKTVVAATNNSEYNEQESVLTVNEQNNAINVDTSSKTSLPEVEPEYDETRFHYEPENDERSEVLQNDSALGESINIENVQSEVLQNDSALGVSLEVLQNDSALGESINVENIESDVLHNDSALEASSNVFQINSDFGEIINEKNSNSITEGVKDEEKDNENTPSINEPEVVQGTAAENNENFKEAETEEKANLEGISTGIGQSETESKDSDNMEKNEDDNQIEENASIANKSDSSARQCSSNHTATAFTETSNQGTHPANESADLSINNDAASESIDARINCTNVSLKNDSALGNSLPDSCASAPDDGAATTKINIEDSVFNDNHTVNENTPKNTSDCCTDLGHRVKSLTKDLNKSDYCQESFFDEIETDNKCSIDLPSTDNELLDETQINLDEIRIHLPHLDDEGVFFSDLDEQDQRMLSPTVMALDVFPCLSNKKNITIIVDEDLRAMLNISDDEPETYEIPAEKRPKSPPPLVLNILKLHEKVLRRRILFKLGSDYDLYLQARMRKRTRPADIPRDHRATKQMKWFHLNDSDMNGVHVSPLYSPGHHSTDFCGFSDIDTMSEFNGFSDCDEESSDATDKTHRLSRDSGVDGIDGGPTVINEIIIFPSIEEERLDEGHLMDSRNDVTHEVGQKASDAVKQTTLSEGGDTVQVINPTEENENKKEEPREKPVNEASICQSEEAGEQRLPQINNATTESDCMADVTTFVDNTNSFLSDSGIDLGITADLEVRSTSISQTAETQNADCFDNDNFTFEDNMETDGGNNETPLTPDLNKDLQSALNDIDLSSSKTKIQKWHEHLQPILAKSRERHHFDVFEMGTEIMNELELQNKRSHASDSHSSLKSCISFQDVMENKDASYVSRYFLSSLLLANQSNIKIVIDNKSSEEPSAWTDIQFELQSTKRHTVSIEDNIGMLKNTNKTALQTPKLSLKKGPSKNTNADNVTQPFMPVPIAFSTPAQQELPQGYKLYNVNLDVVKPLKQMEKLPRNSDDYDSGIFSSEELT